ncbi:hypothetical protein diail_4674 [Diaporthe ilicicola]|nr:hypothetical protein diail_4674 [Diaporthe ilicicola]
MSEASDNEEHYYSGSEEGDESQESDSDDANHGLLDLEASEANSEPDFDNDQSSDDGSYIEYFSKFMQLPPEIREMVWNAFCPDLEAEARVFELHLNAVYSPEGALHLPKFVRGVGPGPHLEEQTAPMRALLAVHRESRAVGLKSAPHELSLSGGELVRYHEERDVLFLWWDEDIELRGLAVCFQQLGISAQNLAIESGKIFRHTEGFVDFMYLLPEARKLFFLDEDEDLRNAQVPSRDYAWVVANEVHKYRTDVDEEGEAGLMTQVSRIVCWPDLDNHREYAQENIEKPDEIPWWREAIDEARSRLDDPLADSTELSRPGFSDEEKAEAINRLQNIEVWPMIRFNFREGLQRFSEMEAWSRSWDEWVSGSEDSHDEIEDEYESEGIDDGPIDDSTSTDDGDEFLGQYLGHESSHLHGSSSQLLDSTSEVDELPTANFSSDDEIDNRGELGTNITVSEDEERLEIQAARPKRRVVESDSDESATETEELSRPSRRQARVVLADSEDEDRSSDVEPVRGANRRSRALPSDSEDDSGQDDEDVPRTSRDGRNRSRAIPIDSDDDDDEEEVQQPSRDKRRRGRVVQESGEEDDHGESDSQGGGAKTQEAGSSGDEEEDSSDDEDDDPPPPKRLSLADRLRMESRQNRPRHFDEDDDSEAGHATGDGFGYSDDDQGDDMDESDNGMVMRMAEEYEGEDGESEDEY